MQRHSSVSLDGLLMCQKANQLVLAMYHKSDSFPKAEFLELTSELRQAAISISMSIAEAFRHRDFTEQAYFLGVARKSLDQCRHYLMLVTELGYGNTAELVREVDAMQTLVEAYGISVAA